LYLDFWPIKISEWKLLFIQSGRSAYIEFAGMGHSGMDHLNQHIIQLRVLNVNMYMKKVLDFFCIVLFRYNDTL